MIYFNVFCLRLGAMFQISESRESYYCKISNNDVRKDTKEKEFLPKYGSCLLLPFGILLLNCDLHFGRKDSSQCPASTRISFFTLCPN